MHVSIWRVLRRGLEARFLIENKGMSVNKHALMLKKPRNTVSCAYVGVRNCKNKWWLVAWVYQSPVGQDHLFVFTVLSVINPSCSIRHCENVKGETPPPLKKLKCHESPSSRQTPHTSQIALALWGRGPGWWEPTSQGLCSLHGCAPSRAVLSPGLAALCEASRGRPGLDAMGRRGTLCYP